MPEIVEPITFEAMKVRDTCEVVSGKGRQVIMVVDGQLFGSLRPPTEAHHHDLSGHLFEKVLLQDTSISSQTHLCLRAYLEVGPEDDPRYVATEFYYIPDADIQVKLVDFKKEQS